MFINQTDPTRAAQTSGPVKRSAPDGAKTFQQEVDDAVLTVDATDHADADREQNGKRQRKEQQHHSPEDPTQPEKNASGVDIRA